MTILQNESWASIQGETISNPQIKKVSVVVPNYNYARYIKKRISSILEQTYPIYELIILDDASTDESVREILTALEKKGLKLKKKEMANDAGTGEYIGEDPTLRIKLILNEENAGKAILQWKKGFELATGDYVWIAEADDLSSRRFLEEIMRGFDDPEVVLSYSESRLINGCGLIVAPNFRWSRDREKTRHYARNYTKEGFREIEEIMAIRCTIPNVSAVVFKRDVKIPFFQYLDDAAKFTQVGDWYFYTKVLGHGKICYIRRSLNSFRVHGGSVTDKAKKAKEHFDEILVMHKMFAVKYNLDEFVTKRMMAEEKRIAKRFGGQ